MGRLENQWRSSLTRRAGLRNVAAFFAGSPLLLGQQDRFRDHSRVPGIAEMVTAFDFEETTTEGEAYTAHLYQADLPLDAPVTAQRLTFTPLDPKVLVQLDDEPVQRLDQLAAKQGTNRSELLRRGAAAP